MTTLNRQVTEALWTRDIGAEAAAVSLLSAQPLEVREQYFDLVAFLVRHLGPAIGDLGHRLGATGKLNPFVSVAPVPEDELFQPTEVSPALDEDDAAAMRAALENVTTLSDEQLWVGFRLEN